MKPGQRGLCFVRMATDDGIGLTTYGRSSGFCIDPIEKKPLNHFLPGTSILSFGTAGCNLACKFCQNWDISKARKMDRLMDRASPEALARAAEENGCRSVAFTYNDPVIFAEYAIDISAACRERGIHPVAVTAGYITDRAREEFFGAMDAANVDLKAFTQGFYKNLCAGDLEPVKDTLRYLVHETDVWVEITTLLIPEENDSDAELHELASWVREELRPDVPLHFSAYHPDYKLTRPATPVSTLVRAREIAIEEGLRFVYTGNIHDSRGGSTWCPGCAALLVERDWYALGAWGLTADPAGRCVKCGEEIPGRFEARPGSWGRRRQRVRVR
jgi:pyruvate formate lyase activating enzyme